jgi:putative endonuclease
MAHYAYILECSDGTYYCGYAKNLEARIQEHNSSDKGAKYTRGRRPVVLKYFEEFVSRGEAQRREYRLKQLSHEEKAKLCEN